MEDVTSSCVDIDIVGPAADLCGYLDFSTQNGPFFEAFREFTGMVTCLCYIMLIMETEA